MPSLESPYASSIAHVATGLPSSSSISTSTPSPSSASDSNDSYPDTILIVTIVLVSLLTVIICGPILCCVVAHRKIERADKLQYFKDKETEPTLTYTIWKERKAQAFELQEAVREFRKFKEREERVGKGKGKKGFLGNASKQKAPTKGFNSLFSGPRRRKVQFLG